MIPAMNMNRKQRRLQEKKQGKQKKTQNKIAQAEEKKALGMRLKNEGRETEAIPPLKEALSLNSGLADVHFTLAMMSRTKPGLKLDMEEVNKAVKDKDTLIKKYRLLVRIMKDRQQHEEAVLCHEEICRLQPDNAIWVGELGLVQNIAGLHEEALDNLARAILMDPDNKMLRPLFTASHGLTMVTKFNPDIRDALQICFDNIYDGNLVRVYPVWRSLLMHTPETKIFKEATVAKDYESHAAWLDTLSEETIAAFQDKFFLDGIRLLTIADPVMERFLNFMRRYLCLNIDRLQENGTITIFEPFLCSLAEQCFFNEYIYAEKDDEQSIIDRLIQKPDELSPPEIALTGCYKMLFELFTSRPQANGQRYESMIKTHYDNPLEEQEIKDNIPVFGKIANEISKAVQGQYEENPYPRWQTISNIPSPIDDLIIPEDRDAPCNILIAGCGTGRQPIHAACRQPNATVTAIDLSSASIAYGMRKAQECGVSDRIKFVHADILSMQDWPDEFDIIECSGVLHHMEDPFEGWRVLNSKLKPGGHFKIGLYSETAREQIKAARDFVEEGGYQATSDDIRRCRNDILALPTDHTMRKMLIKSNDFYSTSVVRDLIFHVQEHRMTIPQIKDMMDKLGLTLVRFSALKPKEQKIFMKMFPDDPDGKNFDNWEKFEEKYPLTFAGMYQFWCRKTA